MGFQTRSGQSATLPAVDACPKSPHAVGMGDKVIAAVLKLPDAAASTLFPEGSLCAACHMSYC
jgi:hypothetical protein